MESALAEYVTRVYSLRDRAGFVAYLKDVEFAAPPEHMSTLNEVYGDRDLRPYVELYDSAVSSDFKQV